MRSPLFSCLCDEIEEGGYVEANVGNLKDTKQGCVTAYLFKSPPSLKAPTHALHYLF